ncbi:MAG: ABC transporter substrate-binding protein [Clostridium sp.]|nr:ABC transporter substrate-binding protein [Clostridium sp.]
MSKIKKFLSVLLIFIVSISLWGCTNNNSSNTGANSKSSYSISIKDSLGRTVTLNKEPKRIISIAPNITEIVFALGKQKELVGRTDYCDYPAAAKKITSIGTLEQPNIEKIAALKPDLVIASTHFSQASLKKLEELNIKVAVLYGSDSFNGAYDTISKVGKLTNANNKANEIIAGMKKKVQYVEDKVKNYKKPSVYYVVSYGEAGDYTAGKGTFISQMIGMAGGKNSADDTTGWKYSIEKLVENNPNILICSKNYNSKSGIKSTNGYKDLTAVKNNKLYEIDDNLITRQGPRLADGLEALAKIIHPEAFK